MAVREGVQKAVGFISRQRRPFKVNIIRAALQNFLMSLTTQYQPIYTVALGATPLQLGAVNSFGGVAAAAISMPLGWLTGKYGIKRMYLIGIPLMTLGALLFASAQSFVMVIPAIFLATLSMQMMMTTCSMVCGSCLKSDERATGMQLCDTISALPGLFSPMLAALIITAFGGLNANGIRPLYLLQVAGFIAMIMLVVWLFEDPLRGGAAKSTGFMEGLSRVFSEGTRIKTWTLITVLSTLSMAISGTYLSVFAKQYRGANQFVLGTMASASVVAPLFLSLVVGRLADTVGRKKTIALMTPLYALSFVLLLYADNPFWLTISGFFQGFAMLRAITENAMSAEQTTVQLIGSWFGFLGLFHGLASVAGPILGGYVWSSLNPSAVFYLIILLEAAKLLLLLRVPETLKRKRQIE